MDKKDEIPVTVPFIAYESLISRMERIINRLWIIIALLIVLLVGSNALWIYAWMQYDYISDTVTIDSTDGGNANYIGRDGDITNGENSS